MASSVGRSPPNSPAPYAAEDLDGSPKTDVGGRRGGARRVWLHLVSDEFASPGMKKRPPPLDSLTGPDTLGRSDVSSDRVAAAAQFAFISPVEPVSLARFSKSMNRVYIPVGHEEEVQVDEHGFRDLNVKGSNFALVGSPGSSLLGEGGYAQVFKALHFPTMRRVAIKKIHKDFGDSVEYANSFARELRNLYKNVRSLSDGSISRSWDLSTERPTDAYCPYLLALYDAYLEKNPVSLCLVLEYMEGGSLEQLMMEKGGHRDMETFQAIAHNVLKGLHHLHSNQRLHQDIKPANILLTATGFAKLADFGLATALDASSHDPLRHLAAIGAVRYTPPESWGERKELDPNGKGDIWSFGLTMLAFLAGREPLQECTTRSQVETELRMMWEDAKGSGETCVSVAKSLGFFRMEEVVEEEAGMPPVVTDFLNKCLCDLPHRAMASELLQHPFITSYTAKGAKRQKELDAAVAALKTHIDIHKEWKITPKMLRRLARELHLTEGDLQEYIREHFGLGTPAWGAGELTGSGTRGAATNISMSSAAMSTVEEEEEAQEGEDESSQEVQPLTSDQEALLQSYDELDKVKTKLQAQVESLLHQLEETSTALTASRREAEQLRLQVMSLKQQQQDHQGGDIGQTTTMIIRDEAASTGTSELLLML